MPDGVGLGFDVHPRDPDRPLWLGAVLFEGEPGAGGHSDGDVLCHAAADAFLGAAAMGDIGEHFPDTDPETEGISGATLLGRSIELLAGRGFVPVSLDVTVLCDRPSVAPRRDEIRTRLAEIVRVPIDRISVKATRPEGLGLTGEGIGCLALASVR